MPSRIIWGNGDKWGDPEIDDETRGTPGSLVIFGLREMLVGFDCSWRIETFNCQVRETRWIGRMIYLMPSRNEWLTVGNELALETGIRVSLENWFEFSSGLKLGGFVGFDLRKITKRLMSNETGDCKNVHSHKRSLPKVQGQGREWDLGCLLKIDLELLDSWLAVWLGWAGKSEK